MLEEKGVKLDTAGLEQLAQKEAQVQATGPGSDPAIPPSALLAEGTEPRALLSLRRGTSAPVTKQKLRGGSPQAKRPDPEAFVLCSLLDM